MPNYSKTSVGSQPRTELHDTLGLTGAEVSINTMPAGGSVPIIHSHKNNEEIYGILSGSGTFEIDGEKIPVSSGDWIRVAPQAHRQLFAGSDAPLTYVCIQVKADSLEVFSMDDGVVCS